MHLRTWLALAVIAAIAAAPGAQAHAPKASDWEVVASGLDNPRGIALGDDGDLWITEAGRGGDAPCFPGPEGGDVCFGNSGAFTLVHDGVQERVVTGLPNTADKGTGNSAVGASDIIVSGRHVFGLIGGGGNPTDRASVAPAADLAGWLVKINPWKGSVWPLADLVQYEADNNPDKGDIDSDAFGLAQRHRGFVVADAAGNDVLGVSFHHKRISTLAVFPDVMVDAPPDPMTPPGAQIPMQAVPTSVAVRPHDKSIYVGQLTGFPFPPGAANVWRIKRDGTREVFASGFTNITDIAWGPDGSLYVVEIAANGLLSDDHTGAIVRVWPDGKQTVVASEGLTNPTAIAIDEDGTVYVTNHGASAGIGEVLNIGKV
jgi:hypothetical protein